MSVHLRNILGDATLFDLNFLYDLLKERAPEESISHKKMPSYTDHVTFVLDNNYYKYWALIEITQEVTYQKFIDIIKIPVGSVYLTNRNEIGIHIKKDYRGKGYGKAAIDNIKSLFKGPFYANVSPKNIESQEFFTKNGFELIQYTYILDTYSKEVT